MAKTKIVWSPSAFARLEEISEYIAKEGFPERAADFVERLFESTDQLENHPFSGAICPENPSCRQLVVEGYRIIYELSEGGVDILTIISPGQDALRVLPSENK